MLNLLVYKFVVHKWYALDEL